MYTNLYCTACSLEREHEILQESRDRLVRCRSCGAIQRVPLATAEQQPGSITVKAIVSRQDTSIVCTVELMRDERCAVGDRVVAECGEDAMGVEITAIESKGKRVLLAGAADVDTIWTRAIEQVIVKASVHTGRTTVPLYREFDGEFQFEVGGVYDFGGWRFRVSHIKAREGGVLRREGRRIAAHAIKRMYGYRL
jgi:uncharacterized Zn finger protein